MGFFTGFATGFAQSVDRQLKESIERTRDNIDMVSKWRLKKAEEREKERRKKDQEIETLIRDAAYVIGGDANDVNAQNIAAALYKERGLSGFTDDITFMKEQRNAGVGVRPLDFIQRASVDAPANKYSLSEIVRSLSDAESSYAPSDMVFPKGTIKGSGLISAIAPGFDVTAAGAERATEQMAAIGMTTTPTATSLDFGRFTFDREAMNYHSMDTNSKLNHLNDIIVNPTSSEEAVKKAEERREKLLEVAREQGDDTTQLKALDQQLSLMDPEDEGYADILKQRREIDDKIKLEQAQLEGPEAVLRARAVIAARDGDVAEATRLSREADDLAAGGFVPLETQIARIDEDIQRKIAKHGDAYRNSDGAFAGKGMAEDILNRNRLKTEAANLSGTTPASVNAAYNNIYATAKKNLAISNPKLATALEGLSMTDMTDAAQLGKIIKLLEGSGANAQEEFEKAIAAAVKVNRDQAIAEGWNTKSIDLAAARFQGLDYAALSAAAGQVEAAGTSGAATGTDQTAAALGADTGAAAAADGGTQAATGVTEAALGSQIDPVPDDVTVDKVGAVDRGEDVNIIELTDDQIADLQTDYPNDASGAAKWLSDSLRAGSSYDVLFDEAAKVHKGSSFQDNIQMLVQNADDALEATGYVTTVAGNTTVHPNGVKEATQTLMQNLDIDQATATRLVDIAVDNLNRPLASRFMTDENVRRTLVRENNLSDPLFGGPPRILRRGQAVEQIMAKFGVQEAEATSIINSLFPVGEEAEAEAAPETDDGFSPEKFRDNTIIGQLQNIFGGQDDPMDVDLTSLSTADLNAIITNDASSNAQVAAATQEIIKRSRQPEDAAVAADRDDADVDLSTRNYTPDVIFRGMGRRIPYKKVGDDYYRIKDDGTLAASPADDARKSMLENPNRRDVEQVGGVDVVSDVAVLDQAIEGDNAQKLSAVALAMKYLDGTLSRTEAQELKAILKGPNGAVFAQAVNRVKARRQAEKDVSAYTGTTIRGTDDTLDAGQVAALRKRTNKQRPFARGGLMRR